MAVNQTDLDFTWRAASLTETPPTLENNSIPKVKCYRNVIYTWLFHTPLLTNWIDDHHRPRCEYRGDTVQCAICRFRDLARRFWAADKKLDTTFNEDVDRFWRDAMIGQWEWDAQNDAQEYMEKLFEYLDTRTQSDADWTRQLISPHICLFRVCIQCRNLTHQYEQRPVLKGCMPREHITSQTLEKSLQLHRERELMDNDWLCGSCNQTRTRHAVSHPLVFAPPILPIHIEPAFLKTYKNFFDGSLSKLEPLMAFSTYAAADSTASLNSRTLQWTFYRLYGVILRQGATMEGHYVGAFEQGKGHWLLFDDTSESGAGTVTNLGEIERMQQSGWRVFLLAYQRLFQVPAERVPGAAATVDAQPPVNPQTQVQAKMKSVEAGPSTARGTKRPRDEPEAPEGRQRPKRQAQARSKH